LKIPEFSWKNLRRRTSGRWQRLRLSLAGSHAMPLLVALGLISGLAAGGVIVAFRWLIEASQRAILADGGIEDFEGLSWPGRLLLATAGGIVIGVLFRMVSQQRFQVGVLHVMDRLAYYEGYLPLKNALIQFVGAAIALITGQSLGREGPGIHLGAASASLIGQGLAVPNNAIRTLCACGTAAAIAASFNTPLAGVIFAMEVVMMEYTIAGFAPVILAAVSATALTRIAFGDEAVFVVSARELAGLWELPYIVIMGLAVGALAAAFIALLQRLTLAAQGLPVWASMAVAGLTVGVIAIWVPEVMGIGYDSVNAALLGQLGLQLLLILTLAKLVATAVCVGLGLPAGLIGPCVVIGASAGGAFGLLLAYLPGVHAHPGVYAMLGMGAMVGATLHAPLAALLALLETTGNPNIILPGMLAVVSAYLAAKELFRMDSVFLHQMRNLGLDYSNDPLSQHLRRSGVAAVMETAFATSKRLIERADASSMMQDMPRWIIVRHDERRDLLPAADLARALEEQNGESLDLLEIPSKRRSLAPVAVQATLQQALDQLNKTGAEALYVVPLMKPFVEQPLGIVTRNQIEESYRP
jgi:CIC family chloride channel protein